MRVCIFMCNMLLCSERGLLHTQRGGGWWASWWAICASRRKSKKCDLQQDALVAAGVAPRYLYQDIASGAKQARLGLEACLKALHPDDTVVGWKLDRIAPALLHLLEIIQDLQERQG